MRPNDCATDRLHARRVVRVDSPARLRGGNGNGGGPVLHVDLVELPTPAQLAAVAALPRVSHVAAAIVTISGDTFASVGQPTSEKQGPGEGTLTCQLTDLRADAPEVVRTLVDAGAQVIGVREASRTLEDVYFEVMGRRPQLEGGPV
jgi:hypothetical protein